MIEKKFIIRDEKILEKLVRSLEDTNDSDVVNLGISILALYHTFRDQGYIIYAEHPDKLSKREPISFLEYEVARKNK